MVDKKSEPATVAMLPGVELTPEAKKILNKQLNQQIVWRYWSGKIVAIVLGVATMIAAIIFASMVNFPINDLQSALVGGLFFGIPFLVGSGLLFLGIKT